MKTPSSRNLVKLRRAVRQVIHVANIQKCKGLHGGGCALRGSPEWTNLIKFYEHIFAEDTKLPIPDDIGDW